MCLLFHCVHSGVIGRFWTEESKQWPRSRTWSRWRPEDRIPSFFLRCRSCDRRPTGGGGTLVAGDDTASTRPWPPHRTTSSAIERTPTSTGDCKYKDGVPNQQHYKPRLVTGSSLIACTARSFLPAPRGRLLWLPSERVDRRPSALRRVQAVRRYSRLFPRFRREPRQAQVLRYVLWFCFGLITEGRDGGRVWNATTPTVSNRVPLETVQHVTISTLFFCCCCPCCCYYFFCCCPSYFAFVGGRNEVVSVENRIRVHPI